jgi:hypothetical protein
MSRRQAKTREQKVVRAVRGVRGEDRKEHFASGKTPRMWSPYQTMTRNRRRDANRKACRGRVREY